jgi:MtN3 and saliva related transmembrane protein
MLISLNIGLVLWVCYGFLIHSLPIILPNGVTFLLAFPLLIMRLKYGRGHAHPGSSQPHPGQQVN